MAQVKTPAPSPIDSADDLKEIPVKGCRAIIAPHAGYSYSGPAAAWAYKCIDTTNIRRVFVIGPSHHAYLDGCAMTKCDTYATPIGDLPIDHETVKELMATRHFSEMSQSVDEDEHSIEMHLPYIRKIFEGKDIKIVPVLVGAISTAKESTYGKALAPYLADPETIFVVSSDFCHWGTRFSYTYYKYPNDGSSTMLSRSNQPASLAKHPIHKSITEVDFEGMAQISLKPGSGKTASKAHSSFATYLKATRNTICGRHPIGVLLGAVSELQAQGEKGWSKDEVQLSWTRYEHSSECETIADSSVSYASAYLRAAV